MSGLPILKATEIIRALLRAGFRIIRSRGSTIALNTSWASVESRFHFTEEMSQ